MTSDSVLGWLFKMTNQDMLIDAPPTRQNHNQRIVFRFLFILSITCEDFSFYYATPLLCVVSETKLVL